MIHLHLVSSHSDNSQVGDKTLHYIQIRKFLLRAFKSNAICCLSGNQRFIVKIWTVWFWCLIGTLVDTGSDTVGDTVACIYSDTSDSRGTYVVCSRTSMFCFISAAFLIFSKSPSSRIITTLHTFCINWIRIWRLIYRTELRLALLKKPHQFWGCTPSSQAPTFWSWILPCFIWFVSCTLYTWPQELGEPNQKRLSKSRVMTGGFATRDPLLAIHDLC